MQITPMHMQQASIPRFTREQSETGVGRWYRLEGDARPGDVLALAGGALVYDRNENGLVDGFDAPMAAEDKAAGRGLLLDVRAPAPDLYGPGPRGALLDVLG
jgi:hypothetical protein